MATGKRKLSPKRRIKRVRQRFHEWQQRQRRRLRKLIKKRRREDQERIEKIRKEIDSGRAFRMFDSITLEQIPPRAKVVAGYVNGSWPTFPEVVKQWPDAKHLSIAVNSSAVAHCLDVEPGDATPQDAPGWLRSKARPPKGAKPVVYVGLVEAQETVDVLAAAGIKRSRYELWTAHYTDEPHYCDSSCGLGFKGHADATQFTCRSGGRNLDESLCKGDFL